MTTQSYINKQYTAPTLPTGDVVCIQGGTGYIDNCTFDMTTCLKSEQDEVISCVNGSSGVIKNCLLLGGIKAVLIGNGDHPIADTKTNVWTIENCAIFDAGRRCPEVKDGATVYLKHCWIHDWGRDFDVRAFGAWANRGGTIIAEHCLFTQSGGRFSLGLKNTILDIINHLGNAINVGGISAIFKPHNWRPGITRGLTAERESTGFVMASHCFANKSWIQIENHENPLSYDNALHVVDFLGHCLPQFENTIGYTPRKLFEAIC